MKLFLAFEVWRLKFGVKPAAGVMAMRGRVPNGSALPAAKRPTPNFKLQTPNE